MGPDAGDPWTGFRLASINFDELAECLEDSEFPRAAELLEEVERLHPGTSFVAFHRGVVARQDGRFDEAVKHYEAAVQKTPNVGVIWLHLGTLLAQEGDRDRAVAALHNAVRCNPKEPGTVRQRKGPDAISARPRVATARSGGSQAVAGKGFSIRSTGVCAPATA